MQMKVIYLTNAEKIQKDIERRISRGEDISSTIYLCQDNKNRWETLLSGKTIKINDIFNIPHTVLQKFGATIIGHVEPFELWECFYVLERKLNSGINAKDSIEEIRGECSQYTWSQFRRDITRHSAKAHEKVKGASNG